MTMVARNTGSRGRASSSRGRNTGSTSRNTGADSSSRSGKTALLMDMQNDDQINVSEDISRLTGRRLDAKDRGLGRNDNQNMVDAAAIQYEFSRVSTDNWAELQNNAEDSQQKGGSGFEGMRTHQTNARRKTNLHELFKGNSDQGSIDNMIIDEQIHKGFDLYPHMYDSYNETVKKYKQRVMTYNMSPRDWVVQAATGSILPDVDRFKTFDFKMDFSKMDFTDFADMTEFI